LGLVLEGEVSIEEAREILSKIERGETSALDSIDDLVVEYREEGGTDETDANLGNEPYVGNGDNIRSVDGNSVDDLQTSGETEQPVQSAAVQEDIGTPEQSQADSPTVQGTTQGVIDATANIISTTTTELDNEQTQVVEELSDNGTDEGNTTVRQESGQENDQTVQDNNQTTQNEDDVNERTSTNTSNDAGDANGPTNETSDTSTGITPEDTGDDGNTDGGGDDGTDPNNGDDTTDDDVGSIADLFVKTR